MIQIMQISVRLRLRAWTPIRLVRERESEPTPLLSKTFAVPKLGSADNIRWCTGAQNNADLGLRELGVLSSTQKDAELAYALKISTS